MHNCISKIQSHQHLFDCKTISFCYLHLNIYIKYAVKCNFSTISIMVSIIWRIYNRPYLLIFIVIIVPTQSSIFLRWYCNIACVVNYLNCNQSSNPPLNAINRFAKTQFVNYWRELILMLTRSHARNDWKYSIPFN